mmetsp:Transcript_102184/g.218810  ORF Transcript_102184/g.218810 Transcript_102184/m.218810 type:complete len:82 (-) Transcript_102184:358-603(-)
MAIGSSSVGVERPCDPGSVGGLPPLSLDMGRPPLPPPRASPEARPPDADGDSLRSGAIIANWAFREARSDMGTPERRRTKA